MDILRSTPTIFCMVPLLTWALCIGFGCDADASFDDADGEAVAEAHAQIPLQESTTPEVVAVVNDRVITHVDVERNLNRIADVYRHSRRPFDDNVRASKKEQVVQRLIDRELLRDYIARRDLEIEAAEIDRQMQERIETRFGSPAAFRRYLDAEGMSMSDFRREIRDEMAFEMILLADSEVEPIDRERLYEHYERIARRRPAGERVHASTFSVRVPPSADQETRERLRDILSRSVEEVEDYQCFRALSERVGQGPNATKLDKLRWLERHQIHGEAASVLFGESATGGVTPVVETPLGFEVYWVHERRAPGVREFDEVEELLVQRALRARFEERRRALLKDLRREATISLENHER